MSAPFHKLTVATLVAVPLLLGMGCTKSPAPGGDNIPAEAKKEAEDIFSTRCMTCHGAQGHGDGPASAGLTPKPRNFSDKSWQTSVTDSHVENIIQFGGAAVGKSPAMPPNPDLVAKPMVVKALRAHVRGLGK